MTSTEITGTGADSIAAAAARQRAQLELLLARQLVQPTYMPHVDQDDVTLAKLEDGFLVAWSVQGWYLTDRGREIVVELAQMDAEDEYDARFRGRHRRPEPEQPTETFAAVEQTEVFAPVVELPAPVRTCGWLAVLFAVLLSAFDRLVTRIAYQVTRFVIQHARGIAWLIVLAPTVAAVLVLGTVGTLWWLR